MRKSDAELEREIIQGLHSDPIADRLAITVSVHRGIVTLAGAIRERAAREAAINAAQRIAGVSAVSVETGDY